MTQPLAEAPAFLWGSLPSGHAASQLRPAGQVAWASRCRCPPALPSPTSPPASAPPGRHSTHHHLRHELGLLREVEAAGLRAAADGLADHAHALHQAQLQAWVLQGQQAAGGRQRPPAQRGSVLMWRRCPLAHVAKATMGGCSQEQRPGHPPPPAITPLPCCQGSRQPPAHGKRPQMEP